MSEQNIRTAISNLKSTNEVTIKPTKQYSIITLVNWDTYQLEDCSPTNEVTNNLTNSQPTSNQQVTTCKNVKNVKNEKNKLQCTLAEARSLADGCDWLNTELWDEWLYHKKKVKASFTTRALNADIGRLKKYGVSNANEIITRSLDSGWKTFFPIDEPQEFDELKNDPRYQYD
jgi:hypothetical protein